MTSTTAYSLHLLTRQRALFTLLVHYSFIWSHHLHWPPKGFHRLYCIKVKPYGHTFSNLFINGLGRLAFYWQGSPSKNGLMKWWNANSVITFDIPRAIPPAYVIVHSNLTFDCYFIKNKSLFNVETVFIWSMLLDQGPI